MLYNTKRSIDWSLIILYLVMIFLGWLSIYSSSYDPENNLNKLSFNMIAGKQLLFIICSVIISLFILLIDIKIISRLSYIIYFLCVISLILVLFFGKFFTDKPLLKVFFQNALDLEDVGWKKLNSRWISFFIFVAILNEIVWRTQCPENEHIWVNFKVWGLLPISFIFAASQVPLINKYKLKQ